MSKAGDWRNYQRVLLPPVKDLHKLEVYEANEGYAALRDVVTTDKWDPTSVTNEVKKSGLTQTRTPSRNNTNASRRGYKINNPGASK